VSLKQVRTNWGKECPNQGDIYRVESKMRFDIFFRTEDAEIAENFLPHLDEKKSNCSREILTTENIEACTEFRELSEFSVI